MHGVLIIGGSAEAWALSAALPQAQVLLAAEERVARDWQGRRVDKGVCDVATFRRLGAQIVIEAAHPCDARTARAAAQSARALGLPHLQLVRPVWRPGRRDRWVMLRTPSQAAPVIPPGARVLITTGRAVLGELSALRAMALVRRTGPESAPLPFRRGRWLSAAGPFRLEDEIRLMRKERVDWVLTRNAGGSGGWPKLGAARRLGLPVAMIARPARPGGPQVASVREALQWLDTT